MGDLQMSNNAKVELNGFYVPRKENGDVNTDYCCYCCGKSTTAYIEIETNQGASFPDGRPWTTTYTLICKGCLNDAEKTINRLILHGPNEDDLQAPED